MIVLVELTKTDFSNPKMRMERLLNTVEKYDGIILSQYYRRVTSKAVGIAVLCELSTSNIQLIRKELRRKFRKEYGWELRIFGMKRTNHNKGEKSK